MNEIQLIGSEMKVAKFVKERDEAILSLDKKKIKKYCKKYGVQMPKNSEVFWAAVHKARIGISSATDEQRKESSIWLVNHGFKPFIS